jgi:hypothetical protein
MKKLTINKEEYNLINNDERYSNLLNSLKTRGITLVIKEDAPNTFYKENKIKVVFGNNTKKEFSSFQKITTKKG